MYSNLNRVSKLSWGDFHESNLLCWIAKMLQYKNYNSKLLAGLFSALLNWFMGLWAEQHAPNTPFLPRQASKEMNAPKLKNG